jgi:hypothetical protein
MHAVLKVDILVHRPVSLDEVCFRQGRLIGFGRLAQQWPSVLEGRDDCALEQAPPYTEEIPGLLRHDGG